MPGDKVLILDDQIIGPLSLVAPSSVLKEHGVKKIYKLNDKELDLDIKNVLYIVHPRMHLMKWIGNQVKRFLSTPPAPVNLSTARKGGRPVTVEFVDNGPKNFSIFMVPRKTLICEKILEEIGVYGDVRIEEYPLDLIPFDDDVLSMELPYAFKECQLVCFHYNVSSMIHSVDCLLPSFLLLYIYIYIRMGTCHPCIM